MKYIMIETNEGHKLPIIFPEALVHAEVADLMKRLCMLSLHAKGVNVASAGFVGFPVMPTVAGDSESLGGVKHNPLDSVRMMAGSAIAYMPDEMVESLARRMYDRKGI